MNLASKYALPLLAMIALNMTAMAKNNKASFDPKMAPEIALEDLQKAIDSKEVLVVDVNGASTYDKGHIPTAISYKKDPKGFVAKLPQDKSSLVVAYCGGPMCTAWHAAAKDALGAGYTNVKHYKGGLKGWKAAGLKLHSPSQG